MMKRKLLLLLIIPVILFSAVSTQLSFLNPVNGVWSNIRNSEFHSSTLSVPGLISKVYVRIDESGVAHIIASNAHDLFLAQGYYTASNRLEQIELQAAIASGQLSRFIGSAGVSSDIAMHTIGIPYYASELQTYMERNFPQYYSLLVDYSQGVNDYINSSHPLPLVFSLLNIRPFYYSPFYIFAWQEFMSWSLTTGAGEPLASALLYNVFGYSNLTQIWPYYPYYTQNITVMPGSGVIDGKSLASMGISPHYLWSLNWYSQWATGINTTYLHTLTPLIKDAINNISDPYEGLLHGEFIGSNSWIVTASYSRNGHPMVANDPHLTLYAPSLWIPMQLQGGGFNVTGWSLAGIPGILIGHTQYTSWGLTTPEGNSANVYLELLNGESYLYNGTYHPLLEQNYTLLGKKYTTFFTNNGPLIARDGNAGISLWWKTPAFSTDLITEIMLDMSQNYTQMLNALHYWVSPPQNFAMASREHAGILTAGYYPLINETLPDGKALSVVGSRSLLNGSSGNYEPSGYIPFNYLPQTEDPGRGFAYAPNQPTAGENYPYPFIGNFWASGGRAETINSYLNSSGGMSIGDMMSLQSNVSDYWASLFTPIILRALPTDGWNRTASQALGYLSTWNYTAYENEVGITVYWYFVSALYNITFDRQYAAYGLSSLPEPFISSAIYIAENEPDSHWFDGNFSAVAVSAFNIAVSLLSQKLGDNVSSWTWGRVHMLEISGLTGLAALSVGPISIWGDSHTVSVGGIPMDLEVPEPYVTVGSSLREISCPATGQFYGVFPGGPKENVLSPYFENQLPYWLEHRYYNMSDQEVVYTYVYE